MENHAADERLMRLERALLRRGAAPVGFDAAGDLDVDVLRERMTGLGYTFVGSAPSGWGWEAEFRRPARHQGERTLHARADAFSERNAILEAALTALESRSPEAEDRPGSPLTPSPLERLRHARPFGRGRRTAIG